MIFSKKEISFLTHSASVGIETDTPISRVDIIISNKIPTDKIYALIHWLRVSHNAL